MALFRPAERAFAEALSNLAYCNPFLPERVEWERKALGSQFVEAPRAYSRRVEWELDYIHPNVAALAQRVEGLVSQVRGRLAGGAEATESELVLYEDLVLYRLYSAHRPEMDEIITASPKQPAAASPIPFWDPFLRDFNHLLAIPGRTFPSGHKPAHVLAGFFQIRRAFFYIYRNILGTSMPVVTLRGAVWWSVFTHDMRRYFRSLYNRMGDITTLITGPSGTGKELVAQAIGRSRYIPFDPKTKEFQSDFAASFHAVNLSALAPTLIESELFGHVRGAFTGAVEDRKGWLESCGELGTVFLDEIGEPDAAIQVKLLRVLQERTFQRLGETKDRRFQGKIIGATNRDLAAEMRAGRFRTDLYYRLCGDKIETPSLREELADSPGDLHELILFIAKQRIQLREEEAATLADEVETWIEEDQHLGRDYPWPGNFRELEQCVRNVMIRKEYHPLRAAGHDAAADPRAALAAGVRKGTLTLAEVQRQYCTLMYAQTANYSDAADRLQIDRRTLKDKIDHELLQKLRK